MVTCKSVNGRVNVTGIAAGVAVTSPLTVVTVGVVSV
jgi:hypothetical protein